jgi:hypothetical protein
VLGFLMLGVFLDFRRNHLFQNILSYGLLSKSQYNHRNSTSHIGHLLSPLSSINQTSRELQFFLIINRREHYYIILII